MSAQMAGLMVYRHCEEKEKAEIVIQVSDNTVLNILRSKLFRKEFSRR